MIRVNSQELMKDRRIIQEISRHQWMESERRGYVMGFEEAANDWFRRFSLDWVRHHLLPKSSRETPFSSRT